MNISHLHQALSLASQYQGSCAPNPAVGAVVVKDNTVIAEGVHRGCGSPHAEVDALNKLSGEAAQGSTVYVTLEPCCHHGRTPPCTDKLIKAKVAKVVYGYVDPNPQMAGNGVKILESAGISCEFAPFSELNRFYRPYHYWTQTGKPYVIGKLALSLDGKIAGPSGTPYPLTGKSCATFTHKGRSQADAILTTAKTLIADNPQMNVRLGPEPAPKPLIILDTHLSTPLTGRFWSSTHSVTIFHGLDADGERASALEQLGANCQPIPLEIHNTQSGLSLPTCLKALGELGLHQIWVEAGGQCFEAFLSQQLFQEAYLYVAPIILGETATSGFRGTFESLTKATNYTHFPAGNDMIHHLDFYGAQITQTTPQYTNIPEDILP